MNYEDFKDKFQRRKKGNDYRALKLGMALYKEGEDFVVYGHPKHPDVADFKLATITKDNIATLHPEIKPYDIGTRNRLERLFQGFHVGSRSNLGFEQPIRCAVMDSAYGSNTTPYHPGMQLALSPDFGGATKILNPQPDVRLRVDMEKVKAAGLDDDLKKLTKLSKVLAKMAPPADLLDGNRWTLQSKGVPTSFHEVEIDLDNPSAEFLDAIFYVGRTRGYRSAQRFERVRDGLGGHKTIQILDADAQNIEYARDTGMKLLRKHLYKKHGAYKKVTLNHKEIQQ